MIEFLFFTGISIYVIMKITKKSNNKKIYAFKKNNIGKNMTKAKELTKEFNISSQKLHEVLHSLKWITKSEKKGWFATELGINQGGAVQRKHMGNDYVIWDSKIKSNFEFINAINNYKKVKEENELYNKSEKQVEKPKKMTNREKKEKGNKYEEHIANFFRKQGYYVWEHGKEKGVEDSSIDLFIKKEKFIYFVQCKDWETWKIDHKEVKATRMDVHDYLDNNPMLKEMINDFSWKILYVTSKECLTKGAYTYIEKNKELVEYQVISMKI